MRLWFALALVAALTGPAAASDEDGVVEPTDITAKLIDDDLSDFFKPKDPFLGFIGKNYQRLRIVYTSIRRDGKNHRLYHVTGTSQVKANRCDFEGEIVIQKITTRPTNDGDEFEQEARQQYHVIAYGTIEAKYELREDPKQKASGVFSGAVQTYFYINQDQRMLYHDFEFEPESYWSNNQHTGSWTPYGNKAASKEANWGDHGIPNAGDLNADYHEFSPSETYKANGWEDFFKGPGEE